jgi:hypothetical protein
MKAALICLLAVFALGVASGSSREPQISVARVPHGGIQPQAVMDKTGTLHLLYYTGDPSHGDLFYVKSNDAGATWSKPLRVNSRPGTAIATGTIRGGQMALGKDGIVHVAWNGSSQADLKSVLNPESGKPGDPMLYSRMNNSRTAFEPERNLMTHTFGLDGGGTIAADATGHVFVAWHGKAPGAPAGEAGRQVWIAESNDNGRTFAAEEPAWNTPTGACGCCGMAMFSDSKGDKRILYRSATQNVHRDVYLLTSSAGSPHYEGRKLHPWTINACPMTSMYFAEGAGKVEGAWETSGEVFFENLTAAKDLPVSAGGEAKGRKHPRLAIAPNGDTLMAWAKATGWGRGGSLAWQLYDAGGKSLGEPREVPGLPAFSFGAVVAAKSGFVVLY